MQPDMTSPDGINCLYHRTMTWGPATSTLPAYHINAMVQEAASYAASKAALAAAVHTTHSQQTRSQQEQVMLDVPELNAMGRSGWNGMAVAAGSYGSSSSARNSSKLSQVVGDSATAGATASTSSSRACYSPKLTCPPETPVDATAAALSSSLIARYRREAGEMAQGAAVRYKRRLHQQVLQLQQQSYGGNSKLPAYLDPASSTRHGTVSPVARMALLQASSSRATAHLRTQQTIHSGSSSGAWCADAGSYASAPAASLLPPDADSSADVTGAADFDGWMDGTGGSTTGYDAKYISATEINWKRPAVSDMEDEESERSSSGGWGWMRKCGRKDSSNAPSAYAAYKSVAATERKQQQQQQQRGEPLICFI